MGAVRVTACRSCGGSDLEPFLSFGEMPLTDSYLRQDQLEEPEKTYPLDVAFCHDCSLVQIMHTVPPSEMFEDYQYYSSVSPALLAHSRDHALRLIADRDLGPDDLVIEIASNDGYLLKNFVDVGIPVLGIDPARGPAEAAEAIGVQTLCEFLDSSLAQRLKDEGAQAQVIIANNVLAHVPDPNGFVKGISLLLAEDGIAQIEVPYLKDLIDKLEFDTIYHEHVFYFSVTALKALFDRHGISLRNIEHLDIHGGSLRLTLDFGTEPSEVVATYLDEEAASGMDRFEYYAGFADRIKRVQTNLRTHLGWLKGMGKRIAAYGAAAKGTVLLNSSGIDRQFIDYVADKSPHKQGLFLPGLKIPIVGPERLLEEHPDEVLLLAWNFKDEIVEEQREYLRAGGTFLIPIPELVELTAIAETLVQTVSGV